MHCRAQVAEISTHAPRTGSDPRAAKGAGRPANFNPRSPHGERRQAASSRPCAAHISTHAPRTGSDPSRQWSLARPDISTHAPRTGSDLAQRLHGRVAGDISTHAPRTGSDRPPCPPTTATAHFNPRSPHGERLHERLEAQYGAEISTHAPRTGSDLPRSAPSDDRALFQPTLPARGATVPPPCVAECVAFQPTLPARGATRRTATHKRRRERFQPTLPARGATYVDEKTGQLATISTHAPRTGSDQTSRICRKSQGDFNPRSPHGERQRKVTILSIRIIGFAQKVYHKTVLLRISLAENAVILPKRPQNPVRTSLQKAGGLRFARAIRAARPYSISSPSGA